MEELGSNQYIFATPLFKTQIKPLDQGFVKLERKESSQPTNADKIQRKDYLLQKESLSELAVLALGGKYGRQSIPFTVKDSGDFTTLFKDNYLTIAPLLMLKLIFIKPSQTDSKAVGRIVFRQKTDCGQTKHQVTFALRQKLLVLRPTGNLWI